MKRLILREPMFGSPVLARDATIFDATFLPLWNQTDISSSSLRM
jgi:hypothetical protein